MSVMTEQSVNKDSMWLLHTARMVRTNVRRHPKPEQLTSLYEQAEYLVMVGWWAEDLSKFRADTIEALVTADNQITVRSLLALSMETDTWSYTNHVNARGSN